MKGVVHRKVAELEQRLKAPAAAENNGASSEPTQSGLKTFASEILALLSPKVSAAVERIESAATKCEESTKRDIEDFHAVIEAGFFHKISTGCL